MPQMNSHDKDGLKRREVRNQQFGHHICEICDICGQLFGSTHSVRFWSK